MAERLLKQGSFGGKDLSPIVFIVVVIAIAGLAYWGWENMKGDDDDSETVYKVEMTTLNSAHTIYPGGQTQFAIIVTNQGNASDEIRMFTRVPEIVFASFEPSVVRDNHGPPIFDGDVFYLNPGESGAVILTIQLVTSEVETNTKMSINVVAISMGNDLKTDNIWLSVYVEDPPEDQDPIKQKDMVQVDYAGIRVSGHLFDTSIESIATNEDLDREEGIEDRGSFAPLKVYVGGKDPNPNDDYIQVVDGFWEGCQDLLPGETSVVRIDPIRAYGEDENPNNELAGKWLIFEIHAISIDGNAENE